MQAEQHHQIDQEERGVDQGHHPGAAEESPDGVEVAEAIAGRNAAALGAGGDHRPQDQACESVGASHRVAHQDPGPYGIQQAEYCDRDDGDNADQQQRLNASADQHAIVDLQHVEGRSQSQKAHAGAQEHRYQERRPIGEERAPKQFLAISCGLAVTDCFAGAGHIK